MGLNARIDQAIPPEGFLRTYVQDYAIRVSDAPEEAALAAATVTLGTIMLRRSWMEWGAQRLNPNLWVLAIGPSAHFRKSTTVNMPTELLGIVAPGRVGPNQASMEGICERLAANPICMLAIPEFGVFLSLSKRNYAEGLRQLCMQLADGDRIDRQLKKEHIVLKQHWVSCVAASALPLLDAHTGEEDWMGGFLGRFVPIHGVKRRSFSRPRTPPPGVAAELTEMLRQRFNLATPCGGLHPAAVELYDRWYLGCETRGRRAGRLTTAIYGRLHTALVKIAMIYSYDMKPNRSAGWLVGVEAMRRAIAFVDLVYDTLDLLEGAISIDRDMHDRNAVLAIIKAVHPRPVAWHDVIRQSRLLFHRVGEVVESLVQERRIRVEEDPNTKVQLLRYVPEAVATPPQGSPPAGSSSRNAKG